MTSQIHPHVRAFTPEDYQSVIDLWQTSGLKIKCSDTLAELRKLEWDLFLVAQEHQHGPIVGAVIGAWDGRRGWIYHLAVASTVRRNRVGSVLVNEIQNRLHTRGALKINLLIEPDNLQAVNFYRSMSFEEVPFLFFTKEI